MGTISDRTDPVSAVRHAVMGGRFRIRLTQDKGPGGRYGDVLDDQGNRIGSADDYIYGGRGFAVHTVPFAGFVANDQIEFVDRHIEALKARRRQESLDSAWDDLGKTLADGV